MDFAHGMLPFIHGAITMAFFSTSVFFFRFWRQTADRLFFLFGAAFVVLAVERAVLASVHISTGETIPAVYLLRLIAFILIIFAVVDRNRRE